MQGLVLFLLILLLMALSLRIYPFFSVIYLITLVYIFSRWWAQRCLRRLGVERQFVDRAFLGDEVAVNLTLHNASMLPMTWLAIRESLPQQLTPNRVMRQVASLAANERWQYRYTINCRRRGVYPIGPLMLETGDLLGAQPPRTRNLAAQPLIIYPRIVPLSALGLPARSPQAALGTRDPLFEDPARITGMRDYQRGDSPRRIHWKASASVGRLLVKQYQPTIARDTAIFLNLRLADYDVRDPYRAAETAITTAASLAHHIVTREKQSAGLIVEGWDTLSQEWRRFALPPRSGRAYLMSLLETLARVQTSPLIDPDPFGPLQPDRLAPLPAVLSEEALKLSWGSTITVITGRESLELFDSLVALQRMGFVVALILIDANRENIARETRHGIAIYHISEPLDLEMAS